MKRKIKSIANILAIAMLLAFTINLIPVAAIAQSDNSSPQPTKGQTFNARPDPLGADNQFGVMLPDTLTPDAKVAMMQKLGVAYYRPPAVFINDPDVDRGDIYAAKDAGFQIVLVVRNGGTATGSPSQPVDNTYDYKHTLKKILKRFQPAILIVENEQDNQKLFYAGTPDQYLEELKAACDTAHELNIPVADGGLTAESIVLLTLNDLMKQRQYPQAVKYAKDSYSSLLPDSKMPDIRNAAAIERFIEKRQAQINRAQALVNGYDAAGVDYFNFHWYAANRDSLSTTVRYLRKIAGDNPIITNEVGQRTTNPDDTETLTQALIDVKLPLVVWFSLDKKGPNQAKSLFDNKGNLNAMGKRFNKVLTEKNAAN